jgi:hypothetical protein
MTLKITAVGRGMESAAWSAERQYPPAGIGAWLHVSGLDVVLDIARVIVLRVVHDQVPDVGHVQDEEVAAVQGVDILARVVVEVAEDRVGVVVLPAVE